MTIKYSCNRCGHISDKEMFEFTIRNPGGKTSHGYDSRLDICYPCQADFIDFLKTKKIKNG